MGAEKPLRLGKIHFDIVDRGFLSKQELVAIIQKPMTSKRLDQVRDVFVFCCFCGLAYCDVAGLTEENLVEGDDGKVWLRTRRQKTDTSVDVPLPGNSLDEFFKKYKGQLTAGKLLPVPSNQKCNDYLKEIAAICGIDKELTFHMARHTFSTTVTLSNGVPIETVSKMLGHRNIRTTQIYAKVIHDKVSADMDALAERLTVRCRPCRQYEKRKWSARCTQHIIESRQTSRCENLILQRFKTGNGSFDCPFLRQHPPFVCRDRFLDSIQFREVFRPDIAGFCHYRYRIARSAGIPNSSTVSFGQPFTAMSTSTGPSMITVSSAEQETNVVSTFDVTLLKSSLPPILRRLLQPWNISEAEVMREVFSPPISCKFVQP